jgi:hypothetical protein
MDRVKKSIGGNNKFSE